MKYVLTEAVNSFSIQLFLLSKKKKFSYTVPDILERAHVSSTKKVSIYTVRE